MPLVVFSLAFAFSALAVGTMGFAIQRGATCTVAAVDEYVGKRSTKRLRAMVEASLWVAGGLVMLRLLGVSIAMPAGYAIGVWTVVGGALLGFGAWVNGACVFGAIARFGSGEWAYALTPLGYLAGCASVGALFGPPQGETLAGLPPVLAAGPWLVAPFIAFAAWRVAPALREGRTAVVRRLWTPHAATAVIGVTFLASWLLAGAAWPYTELLADLARGMAGNVPARVGLFVALWAGALLGGWSAGRLRCAWPSAAALARCFAGGVLMAWGTLLIPGANDGLILVGMPLLRPYAWLAFATMCVTIAAAIVARKALGRPLAQPQ
jgi:toxin CptA